MSQDVGLDVIGVAARRLHRQSMLAGLWMTVSLPPVRSFKCCRRMLIEPF